MTRVMLSGVARALSVGGLAVAGLIGGHGLGYAVAIPDTHHRAAVIAATGHGYLPSASWAGIVLGLAALIAGVASGYVRRGRGTEVGITRAASRLVPLQAGAFVLLEVVERLAARAPIESFSLRLIIAGVLIQVLIALLIALLLVGLRRVGAALGREPRLAGPRAVTEWLPGLQAPAGGRLGLSADRIRAPPGVRAA